MIWILSNICVFCRCFRRLSIPNKNSGPILTPNSYSVRKTTNQLCSYPLFNFHCSGSSCNALAVSLCREICHKVVIKWRSSGNHSKYLGCFRCFAVLAFCMKRRIWSRLNPKEEPEFLLRDFESFFRQRTVQGNPAQQRSSHFILRGSPACLRPPGQ